MKLTEKQIETIIRNPGTLSDDKKREVKEQIEQDTETAEYFRWFSSFYQMYEDLNRRKVDVKADSTITLKPMEEEADSERIIFVLAAQSTDTKGVAIETIRTFASEKHNMLLRALHYKNKNEIRIHVLSEQVGKDDIILFSVPDKNLYMVSKPGGKLSADAEMIWQEDVKDWESCNVHLPVCSVNHNGDKFSNSGYLAGRSIFIDDIIPIEKEVKEGTVELYPIMEKLRPLCKHLVVSINGQSSLFEMKNGMAVLPYELVDTDEVKLYFYN